MEMSEKYKGAVSALYHNLKGVSDKEFGERLSSMMDEQPHLMGFLFNLDEEFSEEEHQELIKACLVIRDVFITAGMPLNMVVGSDIDSMIEEEVERFNKLSERGEITIESMTVNSSSPELYAAILKNIAAEEESVHNLGIIIGVIIRLMEEAAGNQHKNT